MNTQSRGGGIKTHRGYKMVACDVESAALAHALESTSIIFLVKLLLACDLSRSW